MVGGIQTCNYLLSTKKILFPKKKNKKKTKKILKLLYASHLTRNLQTNSTNNMVNATLILINK